MLINPFEIKYNNKSINVNKKKDEDINLDDIIRYITTNYSSYFHTENKKFFYEKIREYMYFKYLNENIINYDSVITKVLDKIFGYGLLQKYIDNTEITDIRVVQFNLIYVKQNGKWKKVSEKFASKEEFNDYIKYIVTKNNKIINFDTPMVVVSDKKNKLRIEAGIYPVNSLNDSLVIRIHRNEEHLNLYELFKKYNMLDCKSLNIIKRIINLNSNIIIAGKGGSGKTTLLRAIINQIPMNRSICVNEETTELFIQDRNIVQREIISDKEKNNISLEELLKNSLVMSNDIIVVGELKGAETSIFIDAISTGHVGFATVHSNSIHSVIDRLVILFKRDVKCEKYSEEFIKQLLYSCIDYIIFMKDFKIQCIGQVSINKTNKYYVKDIYFKRNL